MNVAISCAAVRVSYGTATVVQGVDLTVERGAWIGIVGPNGAGKTTLMRAIAGMAPFSGSVEVLGDSVRSLDRKAVARRVAYLPQQPTVPRGMRVVDYALLGRTPHLGLLAAESAADIDVVSDVLASLDMLRFADRDVATLSGGELQRTVLARALAQEAPILLLDEPTTALDIGSQQIVLDLVDRLRLQRSLTVVSAIHDLTLAAQFADRLELMASGAIVASGPPVDVLTPEVIAAHFGAEVKILPDGEGGIAVVPLRGRSRPDNGLEGAAHEVRQGTPDQADGEVLQPG